MQSVFREDLFAGKVAFVAGGSSGINLRIAERYAEQGAKVALFARTEEKLKAAAAGIEDAGGEAIWFSGDVREYDRVADAIARTAERWGPLDLVVAGAAGNFAAPAMGISANGFRSVVDIDLRGAFHTCRAAFEHARKPGCSMIAISATQAWMPTPLQAHVCAAKAGVDQLVRVLALEWGPLGVRLNCIAPGPIDDTEGMRRLSPGEEAKKLVVRTIPLRRYGTKDEIADMAIYLGSDAASYITGAVFTVDGGQWLGGAGALLSALGI